MSYRNGKHYSKFYWREWRSDSCLQMCSLAARGLWIEMLCLMNDCEPYGHLTMENEEPMTTARLALLIRASVGDVEDLINQLERYGVFSRTKNGVIYSRRMVVEIERSEVARNNANKRWNKSKIRKTNNKNVPNANSNAKTNAKAYANGIAPTNQNQNHRSEDSVVPTEESSLQDRARHKRMDQARAAATLGATRQHANFPVPEKISEELKTRVLENNPDNFKFPDDPPSEQWH